MVRPKNNAEGLSAAEKTENEYGLYKNALTALEKYKAAFIAEGNMDLFQRKVWETRLGIELYENGRAARYLYMGDF